MSRRINSPGTPADAELAQLLSAESRRSFVVTAGAGSGKTTSLVKALAYVLERDGNELRRNGQQIACVTYTEVAVSEILEEVGDSPLLHVSTLHSFLWNIIRPFQRDLAREAHAMLIQRSRRRGRNAERDARDIAALEHVKRFTYQAGGRYPDGILGHADIIEIGPSMIESSRLLAQIVGQRFPFIFVDESQDTYVSVINALLRVAAEGEGTVSVGFFGDPMQMIYTTGVGVINAPPDWPRVPKPENFRCSQRILDVINKIRKPVGDLEQKGGRTVERDGIRIPVEGSAHLIISPGERDRVECQKLVQRWLAQRTGDEKWSDSASPDAVKVLVIEHRHAADRLGFPGLHSAFTEGASIGLATGYREGTAAVLTPFVQYLLPLCDAFNAGRKAEVVRLLRRNSSILSQSSMIREDSADMLSSAKKAVKALSELLSDESVMVISDIVELVQQSGLAELDESLVRAWEVSASGELPDDLDRDTSSLLKFLSVSARELWSYRTYIEGASPYSTQQGVKGAEFERVLVILDDSTSRHNQFSYDKLFALKELSRTDRENLLSGRDSVVDRTRRLFYVCCSRATFSLAVMLYADDVSLAYQRARESDMFPAESIHALDEIEAELNPVATHLL
jgi:ATP-dependent DNA helicase UvrD/PcrA